MFSGDIPGTITLKDNVTFQLESGATLLGSTDLADYRPQPPATRAMPMSSVLNKPWRG